MSSCTPPEYTGNIEFAIVKFFRLTRERNRRNRQMGHGYVLDTEGLITDRPDIKFYMNRAAIPAINYRGPGLNLVRRGFGTGLNLRPPLTGERIAYIRHFPPQNTNIAEVWTYEKLWLAWEKLYIALKKKGEIPTMPPYSPREFLAQIADQSATPVIPVPPVSKPGSDDTREGN